MVEQTRSHSEQTKAKIKSSLRRIWDKRLKWRRLKEKFFLSWLESIAETAKRGGSDQQELHWDSYEKIKQEIAIHQLQLAAEKLKAKEMAKLRGQKAALAKADKMARLAEKRKEREEKTKARRDIKMGMRKSKKDKEMLVITPELKLKQKLTKIHRQRSQQGRVASRGNAEISVIPAWEKLDEELIKKEKMRKSISLAEQIQAAKNRRVESMVGSLLSNQAGASRVQTGREGRWEGRELQTEVF